MREPFLFWTEQTPERMSSYCKASVVLIISSVITGLLPGDRECTPQNRPSDQKVLDYSFCRYCLARLSRMYTPDSIQLIRMCLLLKWVTCTSPVLLHRTPTNRLELCSKSAFGVTSLVNDQYVFNMLSGIRFCRQSSSYQCISPMNFSGTVFD